MDQQNPTDSQHATLIASVVEGHLRFLEDVVRERIPGVPTAHVQCDMGRQWFRGELKTAQPSWTVAVWTGVGVDGSPRDLTQCIGATFAKALTKAEAEIRETAGRCPTCRRPHAETAPHTTEG